MVNAIHNVNEDNGDKDFVKVRVSEENANNFHYLYAMVDSGNRACSLISEKAFQKIFKDHTLLPTPKNAKNLNGAGDGHALIPVGRSKEILNMWFYNPDPSERRTLKVKMRPLVVKNLHLPFLLSYKDLKAMGATVHFKTDILELPYLNEKPLQIPMRSNLIKNTSVVTHIGVRIEPGQEVVFPAEVIKSQIDAEILIEPDEAFIDKTKVKMMAVVDKVRRGSRVAVRIWNPTTHPVSIKPNTRIGQAVPFSEKPLPDVMACLANNAKAKAKVQPPPEDFEVDLLFKRLWNDLFGEKDTILTDEQKIQVIKMFICRRNALALNPEDVGLVKGLQFGIDTGDHLPISCKSRPLPPHLLEDLKAQIKKWMSQGVAEPSQGPWASALVPVMKKNGGWRFAVDYRKLNAITKKDARPVANLNDRLSLLKSQNENPLRFWASLDLSEAYHSVEVKEEDKDKTAVITPLGLYRFNRMTFGFCNAPQTFHQVVQMLEKSMLEKDPTMAQTILLYFDDAILGGHSFEELLTKLDLFLSTVEELGLKIQPKKCTIGAKELKWLGHTITEEGIQPDPQMVRTIKDWDPPHDSTTLGALVGALNYFRKFIRNYAKKTETISGLVKKTGKYQKGRPVPLGEPWSKKHQEELDSLLDELLKPPILMHPDFGPNSGPFIISVDTSSHGVGMSLSQEQLVLNPVTQKKEMREVFIGFGSRKLNDAQSRWSSYRMELYGLVIAVQKFRYFLLGRKFKIRTDNKALEMLMKSTNNNMPAQCFRWAQTLSDYDFEITHVPGKKMTLVDSISRKSYKPGDQGTLDDFIPFRDVRWDDELDSVEDARIREDDEFWIPLLKKRHTSTDNQLQVSAITRAQRKLDVIPEDENVEDDTVLETGETVPLRAKTPIPEAEFMTEEETWTNIAEGLPNLQDVEIQVEKPPISSYLMTTLKAQQRLDIAVSTIMKCLDDWPNNTEDKIQELFGQSEEESEDEAKLRKLFQASKDGTDYEVRNGVLFIQRTFNSFKRLVIVVPKNMLDTCIQAVHHGEGHFHLGIDRSYTVFQQYFFDPQAKDKLTKYINTCKVCQEGKRIKSKTGPGLGQTSSRPHERLKKFSMDCVQMPKGRNGFNYILTMVDISTTWVEAFPMKAATTQNICKILDNDIFPRYGEGLTFICDQGREFIAHKLRDLVSKYHGRIYFGTSHHPNSNPIERHHRTLLSLIRCLLIDENKAKEEWPETIPKALYTLRASPNGQTRESAFNRVYGFYPSTQLASWLGRNPNDDLENLNQEERDQTFLDGPYPQQDEPDFDVDETEDQIVINSGDDKRVLKKIPGRDKTFFAEINLVDQEVAQTQRDRASRIRHLQNKERFDQRIQPRRYRPYLYELVDWKSYIDPTSTDSRKLQNLWRGPFAVTKIRNHPFNVNINKLDLETMELDPQTRDVYTGDLRPTLALAFRNRPHQGWSPFWFH